VLVELFALLAAGKLPPQAAAEEYKPPPIEAAFRAAYALLERKAELPLHLDDVLKIAQVQYTGNEDTAEFIDEVRRCTPSDAVLQSVQQAAVIRAVQRISSEQLGTGDFDVSRFTRLLDVRSASDVHAELVADPGEDDGSESFNVIPTWPSKIMRYFGGFNAELVYVAGRAKQGKTGMMANLIVACPHVRALYIPVADYSKREFERILRVIDPSSVTRDNLWIADFTDRAATIADVQQVVADCNPQLILVDRSEMLARPPGIPHAGGGFDAGLSYIAGELRRLAKRANAPVLTDSQVSWQNEQADFDNKRKYVVMPDSMAGDHTQRYAQLDLFFGLARGDGGVYITIAGRRQGRGLPETVHVPTDRNGRYVWEQAVEPGHARADDFNW
jgi:hypothetical protein